MPTPDDPEEPTTASEETRAPVAPSQPSVDWEKRYKGLQQAYDKLQKKYDTLDASHNQVITEMEEIRQNLKGHEGEKKVLADTLAKLEADKNELQGKIAAHAIERDRIKLIMGEYADLAKFEAQGLLPIASSIEELKPKLDAFRDAFKSSVGEEARNKILGSSPSGGNTSPLPTRSKEEVFAKLTRLAGSRDPKDREEYERLRDEWDELDK